MVWHSIRGPENPALFAGTANDFIQNRFGHTGVEADLTRPGATAAPNGAVQLELAHWINEQDLPRFFARAAHRSRSALP